MSQLLMKNFDEFFMPAIFERVSQRLEVFNQASLGALTFTTEAIIGSFKHTSFYATLEAAARDVDQFKSTNPAVANTDLTQKEHVEVKFKDAFGPIVYEPGQMSWLQKPTGEGVAIISEQFGDIMIKRMINKALGAAVGALGNNPAAFLDVSATSGVNQAQLNNSHALFGDHSGMLVVQVMDGKTAHQLIGQNIDNANSLYNYGGVMVIDILGKRSVITDSPALRVAGTPAKNSVLTLTTDAVRMHSQGDLNTVIAPVTGKERLETIFQSEYTTSMSLKGYSWDVATGGKSPDTAKLATGANWDMIEASVKHTAGVLLTGDAAKN